MDLRVYTINAFAKTINGGNPAGVVLDADNLSDEKMLEIAGKIGFSETAFVMKSSKATFKVRFFTPIKEVDLCGHATIATFSVLLKNNIIKTGKYTEETKAGILDVEVFENELVIMTQSKPKFHEIIDDEEIAKTLNIKREYIDKRFPCQIVSTGLKSIIIPIISIKKLDSIVLNLNEIKKISKKYRAVGYHIFTLDKFNNSDCYCRNSAPLCGIDEEAATGTSSGALASYLYEHNIINEKKAKKLIFAQGYFMNRPSEILVNLKCENEIIKEVKVSGKALKMEKIKI